LRKGRERGRLKRERNPGRVEEVADAVGDVAVGARAVEEAAELTGDDVATLLGVLGAVEFAGPGASVALESVGEDLERRPIPRRVAKGIRTRIQGR
jgi:hypothetical protein